MTVLGRTGIDVLPITLGGNTFGWTSDTPQSVAVLDAFVEGGGTLIDTSDNYASWAPGNSGGESESIIGEWMSARANREQLVICSKVSQHPERLGLSAGNIQAAANDSLTRLRTDRIDIYYAHYDDPDVPLEETAGAFQYLLDAGIVRHIGLSNYSAARIQEWFDVARKEGFTLPSVLQPHYNLLRRAAYEADLAPLVAREDLAVLPYYSLASGLLTGKYRRRSDLAGAARESMLTGYDPDQAFAVIDVLDEIASTHHTGIASIALAWLRTRPQVVAPIASARVPAQLTDMMQSTRIALTDEETAALDRVSA